MFKAIKTGDVNVDKNFDVIMREISDIGNKVDILIGEVKTLKKNIELVGKNI